MIKKRTNGKPNKPKLEESEKIPPKFGYMEVKTFEDEVLKVAIKLVPNQSPQFIQPLFL